MPNKRSKLTKFANPNHILYSYHFFSPYFSYLATNIVMKYFVGILLFIFTIPTFAQLKVAQIFSDNMILQRDIAVPVWGWAKTGRKIQLRFDNQVFNTTAKDGSWKIQIPPHKYGGQYQLKITSTDTTITFTNITFGDIWLCGGQSNMEFFVENADNGPQEVEQANYPAIRLFEVPHKIAIEPVQDIESGQWAKCTPKSVKQFSAVGYFFGRKLYKDLNIPIGLIGDNFGGTIIETWMSPKAFEKLPEYQKQIHQVANKDLNQEKEESASKFKSWLANFSSQDAGKNGDQFLWHNIDYSQEPTMTIPIQWESSNIKELKDMDGVIWLAKEFTLTAQQAKQATTLSLGPIDDSDITWINGHKVGEHYNQWNKDRVYDIPSSILEEGKNQIVVRIEDYLGGGGIYGKPSKLFLQMADKQLALVGDWHYKVGFTATTPMPKGSNFGPNSAPTLLYNGMINPIYKYPIKGVIWYQGETNTYRAIDYKELKINWIRDWRRLWQNPNMPMIWVQLAGYQEPPTLPKESIWAELREAQEAALSEPNTAMITAIDLGAATTIHPTHKQEVGRRLALAALKEVYHKPVSYKSPRFVRIKKKRRKYIDIAIDQAVHLDVKSDSIIGFTIAGKDQVFQNANAKLRRHHTIRIFVPKGIKPLAIRYNWSRNPKKHLKNKEGFPLLPFRTDHWQPTSLSIYKS